MAVRRDMGHNMIYERQIDFSSFDNFPNHLLSSCSIIVVANMVENVCQVAIYY